MYSLFIVSSDRFPQKIISKKWRLNILVFEKNNLYKFQLIKKDIRRYNCTARNFHFTQPGCVVKRTDNFRNDNKRYKLTGYNYLQKLICYNNYNLLPSCEESFHHHYFAKVGIITRPSIVSKVKITFVYTFCIPYFYNLKF